MAPARDARRIRRSSRRIAAGILTAAVVAGISGCTAGGSPAPTPTAGACAVGGAPKTVTYSALPAGSFTQSAAGADGRAIRVPAVTVAFPDFTAADGTIDGAVIPEAAAGLLGAGPTRTVFEVASGTSTHAADIPTTFPSTNQLSVVRVDGTNTVLRGFGVQGTDQGHLYNGLRVERVTGLRASDIRVSAIPGGSASPPGETFGINDFRTVGSQWSRVVVDGAGVGASGFGVNNATDIRICDTVSKDNPHGMGFAFWQSSGIRCVDCTAEDNGRAGFNFERITGSNEFIRPVSTGNTYAFRISSDQASARFRIVDPQLTDGHFTVTLPYRYAGSENQQKASDITLVVHGKVRPDLLEIARY